MKKINSIIIDICKKLNNEEINLNYCIITNENDNDQEYELIKINTYHSSELLNDRSFKDKILIFFSSISQEDINLLNSNYKKIFYLNKRFEIDDSTQQLLDLRDDIKLKIERYLLKRYDKRDFIFFKMIKNVHTVTLNNEGALPFSTVFFNSVTNDIYFYTKNKNTLNKDEERYNDHAETLGANKIISNKMTLENLHCYSTYMPCINCFIELSKTTQDSDCLKVHKIHYFLEQENKTLIWKYNEYKKDNSYVHFEKINKTKFMVDLESKISQYINLCKTLIKNEVN